jgi:hypothetical protein
VSFSVHASDLERLFGARRVCYLVGGYDGSGNFGDVLQLAGQLQRLRTVAPSVLPVPFVDARRIESHRRLAARHPGLFGEACCLFHNGNEGAESPANATHGEGGPQAQPGDPGPEMAWLPDAPQRGRQILVYGGGFLEERFGWGRTKLDLLDALLAWLGDGEPGVELAVTGQQVSPRFLEGEDGARLAGVLGRASMVGVRDEASRRALARCGTLRSKLFLSGDDATALVLTEAWRTARGQPLADPSRPPLAVNVQLSLADYVTEHPNRLLNVVASVVAELRRLTGPDVRLNLITAYEDARISERRHLERLREAIDCDGTAGPILHMLSELEEGFARFREADLTLCCSYHVGLTSLLLGIPALLVHSNGYYRQKHRGLVRAFGLPGTVLLDAERRSNPELLAAVSGVVGSLEHRIGVRTATAMGSARVAATAVQAEGFVAAFLASSGARHVERRYVETVDSLRDTMQELADLRLDYSHLLNEAQGAATLHRGSDDSAAYPTLLKGIRRAVDEALPIDATVLVVSRGDDELLRLDGRQGWHFPQTQDGMYAGHHPADGAVAIAHLEALRAKGAGFLLFPSTGFWWLDYYEKLAQHLNRQYPVVVRDEACLVFALSEQAALAAFRRQEGTLAQRLDATRKEIHRRELGRQVREAAGRIVPAGEVVIVATGGDDELLRLDQRTVWPFPQTADGVYSGVQPRDTATALAQIEALRRRGGRFLMFPRTAWWWFDRYDGLRPTLEVWYRMVWVDQSCLVFELTDGSGGPARSAPSERGSAARRQAAQEGSVRTGANRRPG